MPKAYGFRLWATPQEDSWRADHGKPRVERGNAEGRKTERWAFPSSLMSRSQEAARRLAPPRFERSGEACLVPFHFLEDDLA